MHLIKVDFPEPDGPHTTIFCLGFTSKFIPFRLSELGFDSIWLDSDQICINDISYTVNNCPTDMLFVDGAMKVSGQFRDITKGIISSDQYSDIDFSASGICGNFYMIKNQFKKGILLTTLGSFWWGVIGVIYFKSIAFVGHIEVVLHRCIWTAFCLILIALLLNKRKVFFNIVKNPKIIFFLFITGFLIFANWAVWIYAVATDRIIDASFGYFIMPIISIFLGFFFFKETLSSKGKLSVIIVIFAILLLFFLDLKSIPWVGLIVAFSWSFYNLLRKKVSVETDIGLLIESLFILPVILISFYFIIQNNVNDFDISNPKLMFVFMLAGPMTVIPLYLYVRGVELCGLGPTGMIFYITPTLQFLLGYFLYSEPLNVEKLISFIFIWIAVFIYLKDLYENK